MVKNFRTPSVKQLRPLFYLAYQRACTHAADGAFTTKKDLSHTDSSDFHVFKTRFMKLVLLTFKKSCHIEVRGGGEGRDPLLYSPGRLLGLYTNLMSQVR